MQRVIFFLKKRWYIVVILLIVVGLLFRQQAITAAQLEKKSTYTVGRQTLRNALSISGNIDAVEHVVLQFQTPGLLTWVGVKEGDTVKKYQGIASLDQRSVSKNLQASLNTYAKTRNNFDQSESDNQRIGDQPNPDVGDKMKRLVENAQYDLNSSVLAVELQDLARQYSYLTTPIDGVVIRVDTPYAGVNTNTLNAFEIVNPNTVYFDATAEQTDVVNLKNNMTGQITLDAFPDQKMDGRIYFIAYTPKAGETGTVYDVKMTLAVNDPKNLYRIGMTGDAEFVLEEKNNVVAVPGTYIKNEGDKKYVWKLLNGKKTKRYIKTGIEVDGNYEILSGVEEGDILTSAQ